MSGRSVSRQDRAKACWHDAPPCRSSLVTSAYREQMRHLALEDSAKFVRCLRLARVVSLKQLPWWPQFYRENRWEAAQIILLAAEAGVGHLR